MSNTQIYEIVGQELIAELNRDLDKKIKDFQDKVNALNKELNIELVGGYIPSIRKNYIVGAVLKDPLPSYWRRSKDTTHGKLMVPNRQFNKGKKLAKKISIKSEDLFSRLDEVVGRNNNIFYSFRWYLIKDKAFIRIPLNHTSPVFTKSLHEDKVLVPWTEIDFDEYTHN